MVNKELLIGLWETKNFPLYNYDDNKTFAFYISDDYKSTFYKKEPNTDNHIYVISEIEIKDNEDGSFLLSFNGNAVSNEYLEFKAEMFGFQKPNSFICDIPKFGKRYFEKIN